MPIRKRLFTLPSSLILPNFWDMIAIMLVLLILMALGWFGHRMAMPFSMQHLPAISLKPIHLPLYALETTLRLFIALLLSLIFSFVVGTIAAKSKRAGQLIIPMIDILQSVPTLGYLYITVVGLIALFPHSMIGPECAVIFTVFTSQVWNMTLSFYQSLKTVPDDLREASKMYQLSAWQHFWRVEVPFAMPGLLWNAMMSMSGSWFFIVAAEAISVASHKIYLPGIGSYIATAITAQNLHAIVYAIIAMLIVILIYDQIIFRPLVAWTEKFHLGEDKDHYASSWVLDLFQRARWMKRLSLQFGKLSNLIINTRLFNWKLPFRAHQAQESSSTWKTQTAWYAFVAILLCLLGVMIWSVIYQHIPFNATWHVLLLGGFTAIRVFILVFLCSIVWLPIGLWVGMRPNATRIVQPIAQFFAAFPANLFFPFVVILITHFNLNVEIWTAPLMVLGTQWYILFNVIAGASSIPKELRLAAENMQLKGWAKWKRFYIPSIFPYYVTGAITAAGGAWNASIVAEVVSWGHTTLVAKGLGAYITLNTWHGHPAHVALGVMVMCIWVVAINLLVWRKLYQFAEQRFSLN